MRPGRPPLSSPVRHVEPGSTGAAAARDRRLIGRPSGGLVTITSADVAMPPIPTVELPATAPQRIVSLAKGVGETLAALGVAIAGRRPRRDERCRRTRRSRAGHEGAFGERREGALAEPRPGDHRRVDDAAGGDHARSRTPVSGWSRCRRRTPSTASPPARTPSPRPSACRPRSPTRSSPRPAGSGDASPPPRHRRRAEGRLPLRARHIGHLPRRRQGFGRRRAHQCGRWHRCRCRGRLRLLRAADGRGGGHAESRRHPRHEQGPGVRGRSRRPGRPARRRADEGRPGAAGHRRRRHAAAVLRPAHRAPRRRAADGASRRAAA